MIALLSTHGPRFFDLALARLGLALICLISVAGCSKNAADYVRAAEAHRAKGEFPAAIIQLKNALIKEPNHLEANILIGLSYAQTGEANEAERKLRRALDLGAPQARVLPALGQALIETEQYKEAVDVLRKGKDLDAESVAQVALLIGRAQVELKQLAEARTQFLIASTTKAADGRLGLARIALAEDDRKGAYTIIDEVLASSPASIEAWIAKGDLLRGDYKFDEALAAYQKASAIDPLHVIAHVSQAAAFIGLQKYPEAHAELAKAQQRAPNNVMLRFTAASLALRERKYDECTDHLAAVFRVVPRHLPSLLIKGAMHFAKDELQQAEVTFHTYLLAQPGNVYARKMLAAVFLRKDQPKSTLYLVEPMIPLLENDAELLAIAAEAYLKLGATRRANEYFAKAVALDPNNPATRAKFGLTQLRTGDRDKGIAELESAIALNPGESNADHLLVMTLLGQRDFDKAQQTVAALEKRRPDKADTHFLKGAVYRARQEWSAARASFEQALKLQPTSFAAAASLAQLDMQEKKSDAARARMEGILKIDPRNLDAMLLLGLMDLEAGRQKEGIAWLRKAVDAHPHAVQRYAVLADSLLASGNAEEAIAVTLRARDVNPKDPRLLELLGDAQMAAGKKDAAISSYAAAANLQTNAVAAQIKLAEAFSVSGNYREAENVIRRALQVAPRSIEAKVALAENMMRTKQFREAADVARQIQSDAPRRPVGHTLEGEIAMGTQDYARAAAAFERADALQASGLVRVRLHQARSQLGKGPAPDAALREWIKNNPDDISTRFYLGELENRAGRHKAAIEHYRAILKIDAKHVPALNNLAWSLHQEGDPKAAEYAVLAFNYKPNDAAVADTAGWILVSQGKLLEGLPILTKAVALDGQNPEIRYHFVQALLKAGDNSRARAELKTLLASGKPFPHLDEARALMNRLGP